MSKAPLPAHSTESRQPAAAAQQPAGLAISELGYADNRPEAVAQRELAGGIESSPRLHRQSFLFNSIRNNPHAMQQKAQTDRIANSPRILQQKASLDAVGDSSRLGTERGGIASRPANVAQKREEEELPGDREAAQRREAGPSPDRTGLPDQLKSGVESISGMSLDNVRVHYNSAQPAQLNALAYAQGSDIHVAPGQEKHLPHEAWHIVQQAQGRVRPTLQMRGSVPVNDDAGLEHEADVMGAKALQMRVDSRQARPGVNSPRRKADVAQLQSQPAVQDPTLAKYVELLFAKTPATGDGTPESGAGKGDGTMMAACSYAVNVRLRTELDREGIAARGRQRKLPIGVAEKRCKLMLKAIGSLLDRHDNPKSTTKLSDRDYDIAADLETDLKDATEGNYPEDGYEFEI